MTQLDWAVVRCMDGRLNKPLAAFLQAYGLPEAYDLISVPGGARDVNDAESCLYRSIEDISLALHHVKNVLLIQHTDCGAYGGRANCGGTEQADHSFQLAELKKAGETLKQAHSDLAVHLALAHIRDDGSVTFEKL
jgi:carbonic anhydrase